MRSRHLCLSVSERPDPAILARAFMQPITNFFKRPAGPAQAARDPPIMHYAKGPCGPVLAEHEGDKANCYVCKEPVYVKREHKRRRNGIEHTVRAHFCHYPSSTCRGENAGGESADHLAAKDKVVQGAGPFVFRCRCGTNIPVHIEGTRQLEVRWHDRRLDVGVLCDGVVVGAIEVLHSHAMEDDKVDELTSGGLAWCEVRAKDVFSSPVRCVRCAVTLCDACIAKEDSKAEAALQASMDTLSRIASERMRVESYTRTIESKLEALGLPPEARACVHKSMDPTTWGYETVVALTKRLPNVDSIELAETRWAEMELALKRLAQEKVASYHRALDVKIGPLELSEDVCISLHEEIDQTHPFEYETLVELTGINPDAETTKAVEEKWAKMISALKQAGSPEAYAQQRLNAQVLRAVEGKADPHTAEELLEAYDTDLLQFGKYKGMTVQQVYRQDPGYVRYLAMYTGHRDEKYNKPDEELNDYSAPYKDTARGLLRGVCLMCYCELDEEWKNWCGSCFRNA